MKKGDDTHMFNIGDVVKLKSGGPAMTVRIVRQGEKRNFYSCIWFGEGEFISHTDEGREFSEVSLVLKGTVDYNKLD